MTLERYQSDAFGGLGISREAKIDGCPPIPTLTFTPSNTFTQSNAFSNTITQSNSFIESLLSGATLYNTFILLYLFVNFFFFSHQLV